MIKQRAIEHKAMLSIASNFQYSVGRIYQLKDQQTLSASQQDILSLYEKYVAQVVECIYKFNPLERTILEREYFTPLPTGWWEAIYSRSTFYRLRLNITRKFLRVFPR